MLALACTLAVLLVSEVVFSGFAPLVLDRRMRARDAARAAAGQQGGQQVVIVDVPTAEIEAWRADQPGARDRLAALIHALDRQDPAVVVINVPLRGQRAADPGLAEAMRRCGVVVLRADLTSPRPGHYNLALPLGLNARNAAAGHGFVHWMPDRDGVVRRFTQSIADETGAAFAERAAFAHELALPIVACAVARGLPPDSVATRPLKTPTGHPRARRGVLLFCDGPPGHGFATIAPEDVLLDRAPLTGKVVILGTTNLANSAFNTPLSHSTRPELIDLPPEYMSDTELLANAIHTQLDHHVLVEWSRFAAFLLTFLFALGAVLAGYGLPTAVGLAAVIAGGAGWLAAAEIAFAHWLVLPLAEPLAVLLVGYPAALIRRVHDERDRAAAAAREAHEQRRRMAELDDTKQQLMRTVVHDLKVPVTIIKGQALTLLGDAEHELGAELHEEFLATMAAQCDRLTSMIEDILDTDPSRPLHLRREPTDLVTLVRQVIDMHRAATDRHEFDLVARPVGSLEVDHDLVLRVLNNLVSNAVKYSPNGGTVTVDVGPGADSEVVVSVRDQGIGMSREQVARLFGMFSRVLDDPASIPGTGIGLFSARRLAEAHGGRIEVDSTLGGGSEFRLVLPRSAPEVP
ncbi:MAG: CHASE2 domain-containing protein [Armatimonadetes bacterium]|nr:CHASE2 domain-containing protein [Armatimonadota bacterium]